MNDDKISDKVSDLLYEGIAKLDYRKFEYDIGKHQPQHASWIVLDAVFSEYATDVYTVIEYSDAASMQAELIRLVRAVFTPELLEHIRDGSIKDLTLSIGPHAFNGSDLNEENCIEIKYG